MMSRREVPQGVRPSGEGSSCASPGASLLPLPCSGHWPRAWGVPAPDPSPISFLVVTASLAMSRRGSCAPPASHPRPCRVVCFVRQAQFPLRSQGVPHCLLLALSGKRLALGLLPGQVGKPPKVGNYAGKPPARSRGPGARGASVPARGARWPDGESPRLRDVPISGASREEGWRPGVHTPPVTPQPWAASSACGPPPRLVIEIAIA